MTEDRNIKPDQVEQRSLGATLLAAGVTGTTAGVANAVTHQVIDKVTGKPKEQPEK